MGYTTREAPAGAKGMKGGGGDPREAAWNGPPPEPDTKDRWEREVSSVSSAPTRLFNTILCYTDNSSVSSILPHESI